MAAGGDGAPDQAAEGDCHDRKSDCGLKGGIHGNSNVFRSG
jgi:hypothetical protein